MSGKPLKELIIAEVEAGKLVLPIFNPTALELRRVGQSDNASIEEITELLRRDQALASRLLMFANSAFYAGLKKVETIAQAIVRLGTQRVVKLALVASMAMSHQVKSPAIAARMPGLWRRSYASAAGAEWLVREGGLELEADTAFLAALLHDIGELYLLKLVDKLMLDTRELATVPAPLVDEIVHDMHGQVGHDVMLRWHLPDRYALVARHHHDTPFDVTDTLLLVTRLMDLVCSRLGIGCSPDSSVELAATLEAQSLGLSEIKLAQLEIHLEDAMQAAG